MIRDIWQILLLSSYFLMSSSQTIFARLEFKRGIDRANPSRDHLKEHKEFIDKNFKKDGRYNLRKTKEFLKKLKKERKNISNDIAETKILEEVELYIKKPSKAQNKRREPKWLLKEEVMVTLDEYLIPKIKKLIANILIGAGESQCEAIAHNFIRGYVHYYVPNAHRSIFPFDVDFTHSTTHIIKRYKFKKDNKNKVDAVNLQVEDENRSEINKCLGVYRTSGHYLSQKNLKN